MEDFFEETTALISWRSDARANREFRSNARARVLVSTVRRDAPAVIMLHALMSASDVGYRLWARRFNSLGWNAAFVHLPFHYSRRPRGFLNGELCCTADLILTGDTLRQAVVEIRQLINWLREHGAGAIGLLGTSYGGWIAALAGLLEPDLHFLALLAPMVNITHALYDGPTSWTIRNQLARVSINREMIGRHAHLSSPMSGRPSGALAARTLIVGGQFDRVVRLRDLEALHAAWPNSELITLPQAHFGYGMIPRALSWLEARDLLAL